jgi:predicted small integral membrane protein
MTLSNRNDISITELVFYTPALLFSVFLCLRHGFGPNKGWLFLLIFGLIRLVGASLELATIGFPTSIPLQTSAALLSSVGLSPLMFITLGLLFRVCKSINKNHYTVIQTMHIRLLRIPIIIALVLVIIGSNTSAGDLIHDGTYPIQQITKIGIIILVAIFAVIFAITALFMYRRSDAEPEERRLIKAIATSLPFLLIRLVYVVLIYFSHIRTFSILYGSIVALGCMAIMQEMLVVIIYIGVGLTLPRKTKEHRVQMESRWSRGRMRLAGGFQRFIQSLERPKAFFRRLRGHDRSIKG